MAGDRRSSSRIRTRTSVAEATSAAENLRTRRSGRTARRGGDHGRLRLPDVSIAALLMLGTGILSILLIAVFNPGRWLTFGSGEEAGVNPELMRVITPMPAPRMMDLAMFEGEHKESLYWGTYRPDVFLGIRARTPHSLIAGLMWIGVKDGRYVLRHICSDANDLSMYGWTDHNGRDYGRQVVVDHVMTLTTSFLKEKGEGSGYGGDWSIRIVSENNSSWLDENISNTGIFFFYLADEEGNSLRVHDDGFAIPGATYLASGYHKDVGNWGLYIDSKDILEIHFAGFRTSHMHNLTELADGALAQNKGRLPDTSEEGSNIVFFQISAKLPSQLDIVFVSGANGSNSMVYERVNNLTGNMLTKLLDERQTYFEERYNRSFSSANKVGSEEISVGRAAIGNMLGGIGYFYGQSKIALPKGFSLKNGSNFIYYWPAALFSAVPSRSSFPRGFLWDEGFHQLLVWRWDIDISLDIVGHWLDLINIDGWIPREQILGAEALSKVPEEFVLQHTTNGNPPTFFLLLRDLLNSMNEKKLSVQENRKIILFLERAYTRLGVWFQWFNSTQPGKDVNTFYWHGRNGTTIKELNPKTLSSGLDDYPRASHPSEEERHVDLRCWMLLAARCMHTITELLGMENKNYLLMADQLSNFEGLNQMHLDEVSGSYLDFGNHTEKVRLRWHEVKDGDHVTRAFIRQTLETPHLTLVPQFGYVSLFPFMMGIIPPESSILEKQLDFISNRSVLWTDYGLRSLSKTSSLYMKRNTEVDPPYWRGSIWINMNYLILSALHHYAHADGPYGSRSHTLYLQLRSNLIRNIVKNYRTTGFLWEQYDQKNKGKGKGVRPFTGWTALLLLIMSEQYPKL